MKSELNRSGKWGSSQLGKASVQELPLGQVGRSLQLGPYVIGQPAEKGAQGRAEGQLDEGELTFDLTSGTKGPGVP